jgi:catechol 2,3-dioxygenase-like lactoylglutathione lyase family enzyme
VRLRGAWVRGMMPMLPALAPGRLSFEPPSTMRIPKGSSIACALLACVALAAQSPTPTSGASDSQLPLGAFSVSLSVKDIAASRAFYEKLGFQVVLGQQQQNWLILRSGTTTIGLYQGLFEGNLMTFNPGWDAQAQPLESFVDVRDLQRKLEAEGIVPTTRADTDSTGPASFTLADPDGNVILFDQHVPGPKTPQDK